MYRYMYLLGVVFLFIVLGLIHGLGPVLLPFSALLVIRSALGSLGVGVGVGSGGWRRRGRGARGCRRGLGGFGLGLGHDGVGHLEQGVALDVDGLHGQHRVLVGGHASLRGDLVVHPLLRFPQLRAQLVALLLLDVRIVLPVLGGERLAQLQLLLQPVHGARAVVGLLQPSLALVAHRAQLLQAPGVLRLGGLEAVPVQPVLGVQQQALHRALLFL
mmetsp:Transcript_47352/g.96764  ORF Transcript_47352/g.96764 Transcript_47352/m.96764 type:complete len:216 (-) Transcript_47352:133-780(-)